MSAEARGEALSGVSPVGLFRTDIEGRCLAVSARWCEITGLASAEALGEGWARALHAEVRLSSDGDRIRIVVADDGEGFDASEHARRFDTAGGFGLFAIREMCAQVGSRFEIESAAGKGARALLSVPLG